MTASDYAALEENTGKHLLDVMDGFAKLKCIAFCEWLKNRPKTYMYKTTAECYEIFNAQYES
jgi:hypothetical protein